MEKRVSILVPTRDNATVLRDCLDSVVEHTAAKHEIIVIDNASSDGTAALLAARPRVRVLRPEQNLYFTRAINLGMAHATGDLFFLLNDDCVVLRPDWLEFFRAELERDPRAAIAGPLWWNLRSLPYGWVEPYAAMIPRSVVETLGDLPYVDDSFVLWWSDLYFSYRAMRAGRPLAALSRRLVDRYVHHRRVGESGASVARVRGTLPPECFRFHGRALLYERLGIGRDDILAGYVGGVVRDVGDVGDGRDP